ncbi:MAG: 30S ribosomal protein S21 [Candidatus Marinimicrobia bacterium]|nr:30S ribosomal protein S21 [Candidatus Neomarinimicrobiota bacterium]
MVEITVKNNEPFEKALRRFKKKWEKAGILREVKKRKNFVKPSILKRMAARATAKRIRREARLLAKGIVLQNRR